MTGGIFECIDGHTCGNPVRLVAKGGPDLQGLSMAEKRLDFIQRYDWIRTGLMFEPRGHDMMSGSILYPPASPENDFGVLFISFLQRNTSSTYNLTPFSSAKSNNFFDAA